MTGLRSFWDSALAQMADTIFPARKAMRELRGRWGKPGSKDSWLAGEYFDLVRGGLSRACVDDKTWTDLEFPEIFASLDSTVTPIGSQMLFRQMHDYIEDADALATRYTTYVGIQSDAAPREALQRRLLRLQHESSARISDFIFGSLPPLLKHQGLLRSWALASLGVLAATFAWQGLTWVWLAMVLVNVAVRVRIGIRGRTLRDIQILQACLQLVKVANDLAAT